jgi:GH15 family glucan-1,4-alpha-glucosidase
MAAIEDYALIGDCRSAALVSRDGSIDWLCWPRFDSAACFAALLGGSDNGRWIISPENHKARTSRSYLDATMVLATRFQTETGEAELIDFLAPEAFGQTLVRIVRGIQGVVEMTSELVIRFDYGLTVPWVSRGPHNELLAVAGPLKLVLRTPVKMIGRDMRTHSRFQVKSGEQIPFVLQCASSTAAIPEPSDAMQSLERTMRHWRQWAETCCNDCPWSRQVLRSLLTLKALTFAETGGIVAAPTTSLPEEIGGVRNWDYRFCWLRDSSFTLQALMTGGYYDEAMAWRDWLIRAVAGVPAQAQIMYGVGGEKLLDERELSWLSGYEGSRPVRTGNAAATQAQLDIFGEVFDVLYRTRAHLEASDAHFHRRTPRMVHVGIALLEYLEKIWREPDDGIWEVRGPRRHFVHSKIMAWVAFDRAIRGLERFGSDYPVARWRQIRDEIHGDICANGFDHQAGSFVQFYGANLLDASLLLAPIVGFLPASDPRIGGTVKAIERRLLKNGFVMRYEQPDAGVDGLPPGEGAFLACSYWYVDVLVLQGRLDEARTMFERLAAVANDVGLLAEEYDPREKRMLGNFPQAFSHVALVNSAYLLGAALRAKAPAAETLADRSNSQV